MTGLESSYLLEDVVVNGDDRIENGSHAFSPEEMVALRRLLSTTQSNSTIGTAVSTIAPEKPAPEVQEEALLKTVHDNEDEEDDDDFDLNRGRPRVTFQGGAESPSGRSSFQVGEARRGFRDGRFASMMGFSRKNIKEEEDELEASRLPESSFTLLVVSDVASVPFATGVAVVLVKVTIFSLIIASLYTGDDSNPFEIPASQTGPVIVAQFIALLITVLTQDDLLTGFSQLLEGVSEDMMTAFPKTTKTKFHASIAFQMVTGSLGIFVTFLLIITATDVISLMLDFTAVEFVTLLDNGAFTVAEKGFMGAPNRALAQRITETELHLDEHQSKIGPRFRTIVLIVLYLALVAGWSIVYIFQASGKFMPNNLVLQFDDDLNFALSTLSGPYQLETNSAEFGYSRIRYYSEDKSIKIGYCEDNGFWTIWKEGNDPCNNNIARSSGIMFSFNVLDVADDPWYATSDVEVARFYPMSDFQIMIGCDTDEDCGGNSPSVCDNDKCKCGEGYFSLRCDFEEQEVCSYLELDGDEPFGSHSSEYSLLTNSMDQMVQFYDHPAFISTSSVNASATGRRKPDIMFYSGWRWILTRTHEGFVSPGQNVTLDNIAAFLESGEADVNAMLLEHDFFMSDPVSFNSPSDASSPIGLSWYYARGGISLTGDVSSEGPFLSTFFCGICNNVTNPCQFEGQCLEDGDCVCGNGSSGTLCRVAPLSDGLCDNSVFNSEDYNWDGGDCCLATCTSSFNSTCGVVPVASIESVYVGFPYCLDPDNFCDAPPCYTVKSDTIEPASALSEMRVTLSSSGRMVVVSELSIDTVRVFDQIDSRWLIRGSPLEGVRNTNFGQHTAIAAPPPSVLLRTSGNLPAVLAIASGVSGQAHASVFRFAQSDGEWSALGEKLDLCETAGLEKCSLHSLEVVFHYGVVRLLSVLMEEKVIVMATNLTTEGDTELLDWDVVLVLDGSEATISENGEYVAAVATGDSTVRIFELDNLAYAMEEVNETSVNLVDGVVEENMIDSNTTNSTNATVVPTYETDLGLYGNDTTIRGLRMSSDGALLTAVLWKDGFDGVLVRVPSSVPAPSMSPVYKPVGSIFPTMEPSMLPSYEPTMSMIPTAGPSMSISPSLSPSMDTSALNVSTAPSFLPSLPPMIEAYTVVAEYDPQSVVQMTSDGTSVCFLIASQFIRAYDYDATTARWSLVGGEVRITELERQFDIASGGKTLVVGGLSPIVAYQNRPVCPDGWRPVKISLTLSDMPRAALQSISWKMQSIQMAGSTILTTSSVNNSCVGCYDDYDKFAMTVISEEVCVPSNECMVFDFHAPMGFDDGYGMVFLDGDAPIASVAGNSTDPVHIMTSEGEDCRFDVMECNSTDMHLLLSMTLDGHPEQTSWYLTHNESILAESGSLRDGTQTYQRCVPADSCLALTFEDTFDNGFCCGSGNGQYSIWLDEELVLSKSGEFGASERVHFGSSCETEVIQPVAASLNLILDAEDTDTQGAYWTLQEQSGIFVAAGGELLPQVNDSLPETNMTFQEMNASMSEFNGTTNGTANGTAAFATGGTNGVFSFAWTLTDMIDLDAILASLSNATNSTLVLNITNFLLHPGTNYELEIFSPHFYMLESNGTVLVGSQGFPNATRKYNFTAP